MKTPKNTPVVTTANPSTVKVMSTEETYRKVRELIGGKLGVSAKSIKLIPNFPEKKYDMVIPGLDKATPKQKEFVAKAEELVALFIDA